jgi:methylglutaconyl-CoA hydratase
MGSRNARRYFLTGERFDAAEAVRMGLVHEVVEPGRLDQAVDRIIDELLKCGPKAIAAAKDLIASVTNRPVDQLLAEETATRIATIRVSDEGKEGVNAFLSKRPPAWVKRKP